MVVVLKEEQYVCSLEKIEVRGEIMELRPVTLQIVSDMKSFGIS